MKIKLTAGTNVGLVRGNNEDNFVVCRNLIANDWTIPQAGEVIDLGPYGALLVVADGMGGANAGEVASGIAIETVQKAFTDCRLSDVVKSDADIENYLSQITRDADKAIIKFGKKNKEAKGMGTTLVMAWVMDGKAYICWCGDSRCYVFNPAVGLTRLSKDHSLVQQLVDKGELAPENAHNHPMSNIITQCLGNANQRICPDTRVYQLAHNDVLLLCTDGLCGLCTDDEIMQVMAANDDLVAMKGLLIEAALKAGGYDNVTVALCHIDAPSLTNGGMKSIKLNATLRNEPEPDETEEKNVNDEETAEDNSQGDDQEATEADDNTLQEPTVTETEKAEEESDALREDEPDAETKAETESEPETEADTEEDDEPEAEAESEAAEETDATDEDQPQRRSKWWLWVILVLILLLIAAIIVYGSPQELISTVRQFVVTNLLP